MSPDFALIASLIDLVKTFSEFRKVLKFFAIPRTFAKFERSIESSRFESRSIGLSIRRSIHRGPIRWPTVLVDEPSCTREVITQECCN